MRVQDLEPRQGARGRGGQRQARSGLQDQDPEALKASAGLGVGALGAYGAYLASSRRFAQLASAAAAATKDATQTMNAGGPTTKGLLDRAMRLAGKTAAIGVVGAGGVAYAKKRGVTGQNVANAGREAVTRAANAAWDLGRLVRKKVNNLKGNRGRKWTANPLYGSGSAYI